MSSPTFSSSLLLCVLIKSANIKHFDNECYSYIVLKIDDVKSITNIVKGQQPKWEEEFYFDVPDQSRGLEIELWEHGQLWDKLLGLSYINLDWNENVKKYKINQNNINERWINLDSEFVLNDQGYIYQTQNSTEHSLLIRTYIEFPFNLNEQQSKELTEKFDILNNILYSKGKLLQDVTLDEINSFSTMYSQRQSSFDNQQLTYSSHFDYNTNDSKYISNKFNSINNQKIFMSQFETTLNENVSSFKSTNKPLAFVQPVIRDLHSFPTTSYQIINQKRMQKHSSLTHQQSLSYLNQRRKLPINRLTDFNYNKKKMIHSGNKNNAANIA